MFKSMVITECQKRKKNSWLSSDFSCRSRTDSSGNISCVILSVDSDAIRSQSSPSLTNFSPFTSISSDAYHVPHLPPLPASVETCTQYVKKNCVRCQALISSKPTGIRPNMNLSSLTTKRELELLVSQTMLRIHWGTLFSSNYQKLEQRLQKEVSSFLCLCNIPVLLNRVRPYWSC